MWHYFFIKKKKGLCLWHIVKEFTRSTFINVYFGDRMSLIQSLIIVHRINIEIDMFTTETPTLIIYQQTAIVFLARTRNLPTNKRRHIDLGVLFNIVRSNGNIRAKRCIISYILLENKLFKNTKKLKELTGETIGVILSIDQFKTLIIATSTATQIDNLGTNHTCSFHYKCICVVGGDRSNFFTTTGLYRNTTACLVIIGLSNPVVSKGWFTLKLLASFLLAGTFLARSLLLGRFLGGFLFSGLLFAAGTFLDTVFLAIDQVCTALVDARVETVERTEWDAVLLRERNTSVTALDYIWNTL